MISVKLYGRLCNQLFQYAACIATSLKYNIPYCIPQHTLNDTVWKPYHFENVNYCDGLDIPRATTEFYEEKSHSYNEIPKPKYNLELDGYFQSYKYFQDYLPEIRKAFGFEDLPKENWCSVHIRLGDYLMYPTKHPIITEVYLKKAMEYFMDKGEFNFMIFSDDYLLASKMIIKTIHSFKKYKEEPFIIFSQGKTELEDLKFMASCKNNIIANSTFSLMAALLNNNPDKIVISPDAKLNWFGPGNAHLDTSTLLPPNFIQIAY